MTFLVLDLETQNHEHHGDLASPFHPENYIVAPAFSVNDGPVQSWYFTSHEEADTSRWLSIPDEVQYIVAHNAQFELVWLLHRHRAELEKFLKRGGRVLCTQLAEYMLSDMTEMYPPLDEVAPKYGGTHKLDAVKVLWEQGYKTCEIDKAVLLEYLAGPGGDIENTRRVIFGQIPLLQERGMWDVFLVRCEALLYSAYCKFFGMHIDKDIAEKDGAVLADQIRILHERLPEFFPADMPAELREQFNWGSGYAASALLYGGPMKYDVRVPYDPPKFEKVEVYQFEDGTYYPVTENCTPCEEVAVALVKYKSGKNKGQLKVFSVDSDVPKLKWGEAVYQCTGIINLHQLPEMVREDFLGSRAEFRGKQFQCDRVLDPSGKVISGTPVYSTSGDAINLISAHTDSELPRLLLQLAAAEKIHGTYYVGMMKNVDEYGILRRGINHVSTGTGRLSSGLQQMPRDGTVKQMFVSRFDGGYMVAPDYTALEVVHLATLSGDKALLHALQTGIDMHCLRLSAKLKRSYEEVRAIYKDSEHPEHGAIAAGRQDIKTPSFAFQYGATAGGIAYQTGMPIAEAEEFIQNELKLFPESSAYRYLVQEKVEECAEGQGYHREQHDDGSWQVYKRAYFVGPSGTRYSFRQYPKTEWINGKKTRSMGFKITQLANYPCQGEASLVTQTSCGLVIRWLISQDFYNDRVLPVCTVHDQNILDAAPELAEMAAKHTATLMEHAPKYMATLFPAYAALGIQDIPYPASPDMGVNLQEAH